MTSPVASLTMLSPSITVTMRRGRPNCCAVALAATASVGETTAPRTKATGQDKPAMVCATTAMAMVGHQDQAERELQDRAQVRAEFAPGGEPGRGVDQWWQKEHQEEFRIDCNGGKTWDETEEQATEDEQDGIGNAQACGKGGQDDNRHQQAKEQRNCSRHVRAPSPALKARTSLFREGSYSFAEILRGAQEAIHSSFHSDASAQRNLHGCMQGLLPQPPGQG